MKNIPSDRVHFIQQGEINQENQYVLYWMSRSFRTHWNYGLEYAVGTAEKLDKKVVVWVQFDTTQEHATERHLQFLLEGLQDVKEALLERNIKFVLRVGPLEETIEEITGNACTVVTDFPYLEEHDQRLKAFVAATSLPVTAIEGNIIVPVKTASDKQEYAARTLRSDLKECYVDYLVKPTSSAIKNGSKYLQITGEDPGQPSQVIGQLRFQEHAKLADSEFQGGEKAARDQLDDFLHNQLLKYEEQRQSPTEAAVSYLSAYLTWGMIAPAYVLKRLDNYENDENAKSFLEEILVRRELARNFVFYANPYDQLAALPDWARKTLEDHKPDERDYVYTRKELENGKTHDEPWNECMRQMRERAYLHNHLRMYWGKQILAWTNTPQYALSTLLYLNNKYFLDGNDPNSYANALWVFGLHDRAWQENKVFGKVRIMNRNGLDRKIEVDTLISN